MKASQIVALLMLVGVLASSEAQKISVLVLDDVTGKPYQGIEIHYGCEDGGTWSPSRTRKTDINGLAEVSYPCASGVLFKVWTYIPGEKLAECGELTGQTLQKLLEVGVISDPRADGGIWCPAKISKKMKPVPGQVTLFLKKPTWWQTKRCTLNVRLFHRKEEVWAGKLFPPLHPVIHVAVAGRPQRFVIQALCAAAMPATSRGFTCLRFVYRRY
jgi:hypothetical protein